MKAALEFFEATRHGPLGKVRNWLPWRWIGDRGGLSKEPPPNAEAAVEKPEPGTPKIGLALSSGGAKGLAHIGVIQVLEEHGIPVHTVAGTSMGAYVGAMWASGVDGKGLEELAAEMRTGSDLWSLVDPVAWPRRGFIRGEKIESRLRATLGARTFAELEKPLFILATEFDSYARIVFHEGDVASAVLASVAIPGVVVPVRRGDCEYVDGGVCDPLPVSVLREEVEMNRIVAVNVLPTIEEFNRSRRRVPQLGGHPGWKRPFLWLNKKVNWFSRGNLLDILRSSAMASQMRIVEHSVTLADVLIRPVDSKARWHDYTSFRRYIEVGRKAAEAALPALEAILEGNAGVPTSETESPAVHVD
ncbi:MAG: patatin-like phospholipase family protein [Verrucomicrobiae bacterium]|nr:patatin-like phospholipase family protein [Verrucomicrobiae bacterium]MCP5539580.1 patatin-like phospholipase family protein [Akkermansiaceae bacterium]MCP5550020.1 patatin-like phospholipase family protein [Akkermansiaceae bacterium]